MYQQGKQKPAQSQANSQQPPSSKGKPLENFQPVASVNDLQKIDLQQGTGDVVKPGDTIVVQYVGATAKDGKIFDASADHGKPPTLQLAKGQVIDGWVEGVPGMKVGGKRRILIPAKLAYADQSPDPSIPPNSDLVFDIEVVQIQPAQQ
jgi:FKBP-type peptidyl-prolyl cis-trans isomerase